MHELKFKLCPRWLGWGMAALGWALIGLSAWAFQTGRDTLGIMLLLVSAIYLLALIAAAIVAILVRRPWRKPPG